MIKEVKDISLSFIVNCDVEINLLKEVILAIEDVVNPGDVLEKLPDYQNTINRIDSKLSIDKNGIAYLVSAYKGQIEQKRAALMRYCKQIEDRNEMQNQLNTNVMFYDEENLLSKSYYTDYQEDQSMYSMLAIIKRIVNEEPKYLNNLENSLEGMQRLYSFYIDAQHFMLKVRTALNDPEFAKLFTSEYMNPQAHQALNDIHTAMHKALVNITEAKKFITSLFQRFNAQESDYEIYDRAVTRFNEIALESYFATGSVTSGIF